MAGAEHFALFSFDQLGHPVMIGFPGFGLCLAIHAALRRRWRWVLDSILLDQDVSLG